MSPATARLSASRLSVSTLRSASASASGSSCRTSAASGDVGVTWQVGGDDRHVFRHRLEEHHTERLAEERRRAEHVGPTEAARLLVVVDLAEPCDAMVAARALEK